MLNKRLKEKRERSKLTQNEVAEKLHISPQSISKWERGEALPSVEFLPKLAEIYRCRIDDLFNDKVVVEIKNVPQGKPQNVPQSEPIDETFKELKNLYDNYNQGQKILLDERQKQAFSFVKKTAEFLTNLSVLSISMLQKRFKIGYARGGSIVDGFEFLGLTYFDREKTFNRIIDQEKLTKFIDFLDKVA